MKVFTIILLSAAALILLSKCALRSWHGETANVEELKAYVETEILPALEAHRLTTGQYPASLADLPKFQLRDNARKMHLTYGQYSDGHYEVAFSPDTMLAMTSRWEYQSRYKNWSMDY
jgi:hypothetical protein